MDEKQLIEELFASTSAEKRCEHIRRDKTGPYCARDLKEGESVIGFARRNICDPASLQLWCLDKERCNKCIWYNGEPFKEQALPIYN